MQVGGFVPSAVAVFAAFLGAASLGLAQHQHDPSGEVAQGRAGEELKVGKNQDVEFKVETLVGESRLEPGHYRLQHRVEGPDHFVHLTEFTRGVYGRANVTKDHAGEIKCKLEPLPEKASKTSLHFRAEEGGRRLVKVLIRGENVAHVFVF